MVTVAFLFVNCIYLTKHHHAAGCCTHFLNNHLAIDIATVRLFTQEIQ